MPKLSVTDFSKKTGSPFQSKGDSESKIVHNEVLDKTPFEKQKEKQSELLKKVNKKASEYYSSKPSSGVFTEVVTHGAFTSKTRKKETVNTQVQSNPSYSIRASPPRANGNTKPILGFPSSANDLALEAKSDLESDPHISKEVKEKVIAKLFTLVSMVQHVYESKVRVMTEFEKFKDTHMKNETRREKEHSEQLYKLNMNFQNEVFQAIQRLKSEIDISRNVSNIVEDHPKRTSVDFHTFPIEEDETTLSHNSGPEINEKDIDPGLETNSTDVTTSL